MIPSFIYPKKEKRRYSYFAKKINKVEENSMRLFFCKIKTWAKTYSLLKALRCMWFIEVLRKHYNWLFLDNTNTICERSSWRCLHQSFRIFIDSNILIWTMIVLGRWRSSSRILLRATFDSRFCCRSLLWAALSSGLCCINSLRATACYSWLHKRSKKCYMIENMNISFF